jgi:hypothetical protein
MTAKEKVLSVYPDAYMCENNLFNTYCVYEDFTFKNRISERTKTTFEAWESALNQLIKQQLCTE